MLPNAGHCSVYIRQIDISHLENLRQATFDRILPSFESINAEADAVADAEFNRLGQMPVFDDSYVDMGDLAEQAMDSGIEYYETMNGVLQSLLNIISASLYHFIEQQILVIHRKELLSVPEQTQDRLFTFSEAVKRIQDCGIDCMSFESWPKLNELRLVANTVKHAAGRSSRELHVLRPDLFVHPVPRALGIGAPAAANRFVFMPLAGEDIYVTTDDLTAYFDAVVGFWNEFAHTLEEDCGSE